MLLCTWRPKTFIKYINIYPKIKNAIIKKLHTVCKELDKSDYTALLI